MRHEMKQVNRLIVKSNFIAEATAQRDRRVFLVGITTSDRPEYPKYLEQFFQEEFITMSGCRFGNGNTKTDVQNQCTYNEMCSESEKCCVLLFSYKLCYK